VIKHPWFKNYDFDDIFSYKFQAPYIPKTDEKDDDQENKMAHYTKNLHKKPTFADKKELLETCIAESRKKLIRDYQSQFEEF
jgi:hypothetical protein